MNTFDRERLLIKLDRLMIIRAEVSNVFLYLTFALGFHSRLFSDGKYLLLAGNTNRSDDTRSIHLGPFTRTNSSTEKNHCLQFWYSIHGHAVGQVIIMKNHGANTTLTFDGQDRGKSKSSEQIL
jgi:hypothetical protein